MPPIRRLACAPYVLCRSCFWRASCSKLVTIRGAVVAKPPAAAPAVVNRRTSLATLTALSTGTFRMAPCPGCSGDTSAHRRRDSLERSKRSPYERRARAFGTWTRMKCSSENLSRTHGSREFACGTRGRPHLGQRSASRQAITAAASTVHVGARSVDPRPVDRRMRSGQSTTSEVAVVRLWLGAAQPAHVDA